MSRTLSRQRCCFALLALVFALTGCHGDPARPSTAAGGLSSASAVPSPAPSLHLDCGTEDCPTAAPPGGLFQGRLLTYATHGFTPAELAKVTAQLTGPVTVVFSSEQSLRSAEPAYPLTPVATLLTDPDSYAAAAGEPALAAQLSSGLVLAATEAAIRQVAAGDTVTMADGRTLPVTAVVADQVIGGYEMATSTATIAPAAGQPAAYLLVGGTTRAALAAVMKTQLPTRSVRVRATTANGYLSAYDTVLPQLETKRRFGEFSLRQGNGGVLVPDSKWLATWIRTVDVPQLGEVECNKAILPDLIAAMREITARKLGKLVNTADFQYEGGCFNPRIARFSDGGSLSSHSWGIAVDINVNKNPLGGKPHQDPRLVAIMAEHGFTWGGRWLRPDGAHFEWVGTAISQPTKG